MRNAALFAILATILVSPALAQSPREAAAGASPPGTSRAASGLSSSSGTQGAPKSNSPGPPIDQGPVSSEANQAHRGGGAVLEGAPGAPAPVPQPTPSHDGASRR
jgi:hypothetical protein